LVIVLFIKLLLGLFDIRLGDLALCLGGARGGLRPLQGGLRRLQACQSAIGQRLRRVELLLGDGRVATLRELFRTFLVLLRLGGANLLAGDFRLRLGNTRLGLLNLRPCLSQ
jgi:hypothetical protein